MANDPMLDVTMLLTAQQAYNVTDAGAFTGTPPTGYTAGPAFWNNGTGFKAIAFENSAAHHYIIAFSGTELSSKDFYTDAQLGWNQWRVNDNDPQQIDGDNVLDYVRTILDNDPQATFHFTGHSLGGGLAEYAAYFAKKEIETELRKADPNASLELTLTTFNAMGTLNSLARRESTTKDAINAAMADTYIAHYVAKGDLVGLLGGGHVGEVVNGQINTYTAGTNTRFFLSAHSSYNPDFQSLAYAQLHDYRPEYLNLDYTQGALAQIASLGDGNGLTSSPAATVRLILGFLATIQVGDRQQLDQLGDWIAANLYQSGLIDANTYTAAVQIDWGIAGNTGNVLSITGAAALAGATGVVMDTLDTLSRWAGGAADALIGVVRADTERYTSAVTTELGNAAGRGAADDLAAWQDNGYDFISILNQADQQATQLLTDPAGFEAQIEVNPLAFLPPLTAPVRSDYSNDAPGDTAYQQALTLYNQKADERTQVQTLYNQYVTDTNALNLLPTLSARDPADWQTVITGDDPNTGNDDTLSADPVTTHIYGLTGNDILSGRAGVDGSVQAIQLHGGPGADALYGETFYTGQYYFLGQTDFETQYGRIKPGPGAFLYGEAGNDGLQGSLKDDTLDGGLDHDYLVAYVGDDTALGGPGNDLINGNEGQDDIEGNDDDDRLGGGGADHLQGGTGNDQLYGDARYNFVEWDGTTGTLLYGNLGGSSGNFPVVQDAPESRAGDDVLEGNQGQDELFGGAGDDLLDGGTENDKLQGEGGDDLLFGGEGNDQLWGDSSEDAVTTDAQPIAGDYGTYSYYWRERHVGLDGNDYLDGGAGDDQLWGGGGNDHLVGGSGSDWLHGGLYDGSASGNDILLKQAA